jgi:hypothetical protein
MISLQPQTFSEFRDLARRLLATDVTPERVSWEGSGQSLFEETIPAGDIKALSVPKEYLELAELISLYRDPVKWTLLYRVLYRLLHGERSLLRIDIDDDVRELRLMEKALRRLCPLSQSGRPLHCLAQARSFDCGTHGALVPQSFRKHALVYSDPGPERALGSREFDLWTGSS